MKLFFVKRVVCYMKVFKIDSRLRKQTQKQITVTKEFIGSHCLLWLKIDDDEEMTRGK